MGIIRQSDASSHEFRDRAIVADEVDHPRASRKHCEIGAIFRHRLDDIRAGFATIPAFLFSHFSST